MSRDFNLSADSYIEHWDNEYASSIRRSSFGCSSIRFKSKLSKLRNGSRVSFEWMDKRKDGNNSRPLRFKIASFVAYLGYRALWVENISFQFVENDDRRFRMDHDSDDCFPKSNFILYSNSIDFQLSFGYCPDVLVGFISFSY